MRVLIMVYLCFILTGCTANSAIGDAKNLPPSVDIIENNVRDYGGQAVRGIKVIGLHKQRENAYLIITDKDSNMWGGPYELLRLESGDWVMTKPGVLFKQYVPLIK